MKDKIVLLGAPGSGKGTQAEMLKNEFGITHLSVGDILREERKNGTELGEQVTGYMNRGELVPDELIKAIVRNRILEVDGFVLDGFPRTIPQAEMLEEVMREKGTDVDAVIYLKVDRETVLRRLTGRRVCGQCGKLYHVTNMPPRAEGVCDACGEALITRKDDTPETVITRLEVYNKATEPLVEYFRKKKKLIEIDGNAEKEESFEAIRRVVKG